MTPLWSQASAQTVDIHMVCNNNMDQEHHTDSVCCRTSDVVMALGCNTDLETQSQKATQATHSNMFPWDNKSEGNSQGFIQPHRLLSAHITHALSAPGAAVWTIYNMISTGIMDHDDPSKRCNPERELFLISDFHHCPELGWSWGWAECLGVKSMSANALGCCTAQGDAMFHCRSQHYLTHITSILCLVLTLSRVHYLLHFLFSPSLYHIFVHHNGTWLASSMSTQLNYYWL